MTRLEFKEKLIKLLPEFDFTPIDINVNDNSIFGVKEQKMQQWRNSYTKDLNKMFNRYIYVSGEMYPNTDKNFVYVNVWTKGLRRLYRCKTWFDVELFKEHFSAKTYDLLFEMFVQKYNNILGNGYY